MCELVFGTLSIEGCSIISTSGFGDMRVVFFGSGSGVVVLQSADRTECTAVGGGVLACVSVHTLRHHPLQAWFRPLVHVVTAMGV
jgi:hypothetical protein